MLACPGMPSAQGKEPVHIKRLLYTTSSSSMGLEFKLLQFWALVFFFFFLTYLFLPVLGLRCCGGFSPGLVNGGCCLVAVHRLLIDAVRGFSSCGSRALEHRPSGCRALVQLV